MKQKDNHGKDHSPLDYELDEKFDQTLRKLDYILKLIKEIREEQALAIY